MKVDWNSKYTTISIYSVITFAACLALVLVTIRFPQIFAGIKMILSVLSPIIWGIVIAYLLNPVMIFAERIFKDLFEKKKPHPKLRRIVSTTIAMIFGIVVIYALFVIIVRQVFDSVMNIFNNAQTYMNNIYTMVNTKLAEYPQLVEFINTQLNDIQSTVIPTVNDLIPELRNWAERIRDGAIDIIVGVKDFIIGFIVAVYLLADKEKFLAQSRKLTMAMFPSRASMGIFRVCSHANKTLSGFITGKILDSFIIGMICFVAMRVMKLEYPVLISTIVGVTNIIPFFGPFIGAIPSALLLLISAEPMQTVKFVALIIVLQQFDGNILGPKILGDSTGLPAFWVMFAIFLGGGLFGFAGMLLGVPVFAVIFSFGQELIEYLLSRKGMPTDTSEYYLVPAAESPPVEHKKNTAKKK